MTALRPAWRLDKGVYRGSVSADAIHLEESRRQRVGVFMGGNAYRAGDGDEASEVLRYTCSTGPLLRLKWWCCLVGLSGVGVSTGALLKAVMRRVRAQSVSESQ